jgi:hypothetical protein
MSPEDLDSYRLSAQDAEWRFRERIVSPYLAGKPTRDNPLAAGDRRVAGRWQNAGGQRYR